MRGFAVVLCLSSVAFGKRIIQTSALLPCMANSQFQARKFDCRFFPDNSSVEIDTEIQSVIQGNFTVEIQLIVYGITVIREKVNGCRISPNLCPIMAGKFDVQTNLDIPKNIIREIPGIAYTMPNLDGVVRFKVFQETGGPVQGPQIACVETQLSNTKTVQTEYASWALFGVLTLGLVIAGIATLYGNVTTASHISSNIISLFSYFQSVAIIAMMAAHRVPPIAAAWAQNFQWTVGIIYADFMQRIMNWYVRSTGGTPTAIIPNKDVISVAVYRRGLSESVHKIFDVGSHLYKRVDLSSNITSTNERDPELLSKTLVLQGIKRVSYLANIELSNFFLTGATFFIFIGMGLVALVVLLKLFVELFVRLHWVHLDKFSSFRIHWHHYTRGILFRYFLVGFTQLSVLCLWEFTDHVSAATTVDAVVIYLVVVICMLYAAIKVIILGRRSARKFQNPAYILFGNEKILNRWGFLYVQFRATHYWFVFPMLLYNFIKGAVIALGQRSGKVQCCIYFAVELIILVILCIKRPYMDRKTNIFNIALAVVNFVNAIFFMFFAQLFGEKADVAASIIGVVFFIMNAIISLILLIVIIVACIWAAVHKNPDARYQPMRDDRDVFITGHYEKDGYNEFDELGVLARDGYRESTLFYHNGKQPVNSSRVVSNAPMERVARQRTKADEYHSYYELEDDYPDYRDHQSGVMSGIFRSPSPKRNFHVSHRLID